MKEKFDTLSQQMSYIDRFVERKTDIKKVCMLCGKPATIQHNKAFPYMIRVLCRPCKMKNHIMGKTVDSVIVDLPVINLKEHIVKDLKLYRDNPITEEQMKLIDLAIKNKLTKKELYTLLKSNQYGLRDLINKYEAIKPGIKEALNKSTSEGRRRVLLNNAVRRSNNLNSAVNNKINKIKLEKGLSNKDIIEKCENKISIPQLALIIEGKCEVKDKYKKMIAKALDVKVTDIF